MKLKIEKVERPFRLSKLPLDRVYIIDDYLSPALHRWTNDMLSNNNIWGKTNEVRGSKERGGLPNHSLWGATFFRGKDYTIDNDMNPRYTYFAKWLDRKIQTDFGFRWVRFQYMGANSQTQGLHGTSHSDCSEDDSWNLSFLYYTNAFWNPNWGGKLRFYDQNIPLGIKKTMDKHEIGFVDFKPNRLLMFDGRIPHGAEAPSSSASYIDRRSIVLRGDEVRLSDKKEDFYANDRI